MVGTRTVRSERDPGRHRHPPTTGRGHRPLHATGRSGGMADPRSSSATDSSRRSTMSKRKWPRATQGAATPSRDPLMRYGQADRPKVRSQVAQESVLGVPAGRCGLSDGMRSGTGARRSGTPRATRAQAARAQTAVGSSTAPCHPELWCTCGARRSETRHEGPISAPRTPTTWNFSGADDGIRTRDPHLGNRLRPNSPACTFAN